MLIERIAFQTAGLSRHAFVTDHDILDATAYRLLAIGEHVKQLPAEVRSRFPDLPWKLMVGMRNLLAHDDFGVDPEEIWDTVQIGLPPLDAACRELLRDDA